ncbi:cleft lip and palate transmembrane protein [Cyclospora cayetanensis]|uniref:Cleft lip and palate transmembrane protein n=1 Tax=Cyclospora cayetanensis TaxID=88456 RepID=A0A1D3CTX6_9EIME|nr:cleft lip and palate transmembrane protein [Cyclospora cayetanensis]
MGWLGKSVMLFFAAYCGYTMWDLYRATSAPRAEGRVSQSLEGLSREELQKLPDVLVNKIDKGSYLNFDMMISQYPALPPLDRVRQHMIWHLQEKNSMPKEFSLVGISRFKPYSFDEEEDEEEEDSEAEVEAGAEEAEKSPAQDDAEEPPSEASSDRTKDHGKADTKTKKKQKKGWVMGHLFSAFKRLNRIWRAWRDYLDVSSGNIASFTAGIPPHYREGNQTLYLHVFVSDEEGNELPLHQVRRITTYMVPEKHKVIKRYLLQDPTGSVLQKKLEGLQVPGAPIQCIPEFVMVGPVIEHQPLHLPTMKAKLGQNWPFINAEEQACTQADHTTYILPPFISADISPQDEYQPLETSPLDAVQPDADTDNLNKPLFINVMYQPVGYAYWYLQQMLTGSFALLEQRFGLDAYDMNSLKMTTAAAAKKNSFLILVCIFFFSLAHCFLELTALQADLSFWRKQKDPSGFFSLRTLAYEVLTEVIVALYLHENDSKLPLFFVCLHILLNVWKISKFVQVSVKPQYPFVHIRRKGAADAGGANPKGVPQVPVLDDKTREGAEAFESKCMRWSWLITSAAVCCYGLGFVAMTPQLFRNYYLKSVEYMPWRVLCCQFVNTFVDDVAAYVIRMPKMHRMSVFRDDIVFLILMYQRWLYRNARLSEQTEEQKVKKVQ